jgi:hypothetical protein
MLTNNEICLLVFSDININGICQRIGAWRDKNDMAQIVYEAILTTPNEKMNDVVNHKALLSWVWMVVFNNLSYSEWADLRFPDADRLEEDLDRASEDYDLEKEMKLTFIEKEFSHVRSIRETTYNNLSKKGKERVDGVKMLRYKIVHKKTLDELRDQFGLSRCAVNNLVQTGKKEIRRKYENRNKG